jgi:hypothetical protein
VTGKRKEDFTEIDYRRIAHEAAKEAIGVNLGRKEESGDAHSLAHLLLLRHRCIISKRP